MTQAELLTLINNTVVANGNNEITADVLRPVLVAMVNQINDLVGDENNLPSGSTTVIEAINDISTNASGITIHEGIDDPNDTPPTSFNLGDFYKQVNGSSVTVAFWQYNGIEWVEIISRYQQKLRNTVSTITSYALDAGDDIVIYTGLSSADVITLPNVLSASGKMYRLINLSNFSIIVSEYIDLDNAASTFFKNNSVLKLVSNGTDWIRINNE